MNTMDRRQAITAIAAMSASLGIPVSVIERAIAHRVAGRKSQVDPRFFTQGEWPVVRVLSDMVIPKDERSGSATDALVPEYMDFICAEYHSTGDWMRSGLNWLDGVSVGRFQQGFVALTDVQRAAIVNDIAWPARARPENAAGAKFFNRFRDLTASGFWSSQLGVQDLQYQGNTFVMQWNGCPPEAKAKIGVTD
jgi:hypothetical protein